MDGVIAAEAKASSSAASAILLHIDLERVRCGGAGRLDLVGRNVRIEARITLTSSKKDRFPDRCIRRRYRLAETYPAVVGCVVILDCDRPVAARGKRYLKSVSRGYHDRPVRRN